MADEQTSATAERKAPQTSVESQPLTEEQARTTAAQEGLELVPSNNTCGFKGVSRCRSGKFQAHVSEFGKEQHLGTFATAEEAALAFARHVGTGRAAKMRRTQ